MGAVRAAESVGRAVAQLIVNSLQVTVRQHYVGIEYYQIFALGALSSVVAALPGAAVRLHVIMQVELAFVFLANAFAGRRAAVFHYYDLKIVDGLRKEARQKLVNLVRTVVYGNDE